MNVRLLQTVTARREAIEKEKGIPFEAIGTYSLDEDMASTRNCENMIGVTQVPLGIAGPMRVNATEYYVPLSTTEGALVASVNRGAKAMTESGNAKAIAFRAGATRGPVFAVSGIEQGKAFAEFVYAHKEKLNVVAQQTSGHIRLTDVTVKSVGHYVFVRFVFNTQDAMGMNMVTIATDAMCTYLAQETKSQCISVAGNYDIDKKPAWLNVIAGRGFEVRAEVTIPSSIVSSVLKTTAKKVYDVWLAKCMIGSAMAGSMAFNAHVANVIAAIFLATGQDLGHIGQASIGITTAEVVNENDLYMSVYLPDVMVGTVGGGTGLATQKEALSILGVMGGDDGKNSHLFSEIIAAAVLAGEISLLSSLSVGSLTAAHTQLARGKK